MTESLMQKEAREQKEKRHKEIEERKLREGEEKNPFPEFGDLPSIFIGDIEIPARSLRGTFKSPKRVTKFARER